MGWFYITIIPLTLSIPSIVHTPKYATILLLFVNFGKATNLLEPCGDKALD
jgi:hypothetical protein